MAHRYVVVCESRGAEYEAVSLDDALLHLSIWATAWRTVVWMITPDEVATICSSDPENPTKVNWR